MGCSHFDYDHCKRIKIYDIPKVWFLNREGAAALLLSYSKCVMAGIVMKMNIYF